MAWQPSTDSCPKCGAPLEAGVQFCGYCRAMVNGNVSGTRTFGPPTSVNAGAPVTGQHDPFSIATPPPPPGQYGPQPYPTGPYNPLSQEPVPGYGSPAGYPGQGGYPSAPHYPPTGNIQSGPHHPPTGNIQSGPHHPLTGNIDPGLSQRNIQPTPPPAPSKKKSPKLLAIVISALVLAIAISGGYAYFAHMASGPKGSASQANNNPSSTALSVQATPTTASGSSANSSYPSGSSANSSYPSGQSADTSTVPSPTPTPLAAANVADLEIPCVSCSPTTNSVSVDLVLHKITTDPTNRATVFQFALTDTATSNNSTSCFFSTIRLQGDNGTTYDGQSQDSSWSMSPGNKAYENVTFALAPQHGVTYILNVSISYTSFKTEAFVF